ncbi:MAG: UvrD-helicase domain-containing protein, partial [Deltaproteobacteria bacterium]|nr:UvrD-helicase domain-containing protein [Candidatus Tharpella aukensis]
EALEEMLGLVDTGDTGIEGGGDFSHIEKMPNFDLVLVEGEDHLKDILSGDFQEWRIFLHPYQKKLVEWQTKGPMNINGAAGTGKTVALMHRAVYLARKIENSKDQVLLTTFTINLSIAIKNMIRRLGPDVVDRIEITNLHALARTICLRSSWRGRIANDEDFEDIWDEVLLDPNFTNLSMPREELKKEYSLVIDPNGIDEEEIYLTTVRSGRPRISRKQRRESWPIFRAFQRGLKKRNLLTFEGAIHQARLAIEQGNFQRYAHVLVDEIQDFSLEALKLIKALSPVGENVRDPLCTAGDGHQRIYRTKIPLSRAGINIRGRSRRLKINYRTSEQIRKFAQNILKGVEIDDLDGGMAVIIGDHSAFKGPEPIIEICNSDKDEAETVIAWAKTLMDSHGLATHEICVTPYKPEIRSALTAAGIQAHQLKPREDDPGPDFPGIRLGTIKRIKGLEFRAVALACADHKDPMNNLTQAGPLEKCERYVAATRAREHLLVTVSDNYR